jgi:hypothetical protein
VGWVEGVTLALGIALHLYCTVDAVRLRMWRVPVGTVLIIALAVVAGRRTGGYFDVPVYLLWVGVQALMYFGQLRRRALRPVRGRAVEPDPPSLEEISASLRATDWRRKD